LSALRRAERWWSDRAGWAALQARGMRRVFDWGRAAEGYEKMYASIGDDAFVANTGGDGDGVR
jgi:glycogen synthase